MKNPFTKKEFNAIMTVVDYADKLRCEDEAALETLSAWANSYNFLGRTLRLIQRKGLVRKYYKDMKAWGFTFADNDKPCWLNSLGVTPQENGILISCVGRSKIVTNDFEVAQEISWHLT